MAEDMTYPPVQYREVQELKAQIRQLQIDNVELQEKLNAVPVEAIQTLHHAAFASGARSRIASELQAVGEWLDANEKQEDEEQLLSFLDDRAVLLAADAIAEVYAEVRALRAKLDAVPVDAIRYMVDPFAAGSSTAEEGTEMWQKIISWMKQAGVYQGVQDASN